MSRSAEKLLRPDSDTVEMICLQEAQPCTSLLLWFPPSMLFVPFWFRLPSSLALLLSVGRFLRAGHLHLWSWSAGLIRRAPVWEPPSQLQQSPWAIAVPGSNWVASTINVAAGIHLLPLYWWLPTGFSHDSHGTWSNFCSSTVFLREFSIPVLWDMTYDWRFTTIQLTSVITSDNPCVTDIGPALEEETAQLILVYLKLFDGKKRSDF